MPRVYNPIKTSSPKTPCKKEVEDIYSFNELEQVPNLFKKRVLEPKVKPPKKKRQKKQDKDENYLIASLKRC